jgi:hypothetical protein
MWNKDVNWTQCGVVNVDMLRTYNPGLVRSLSEDITHLCVASSDGDILNDNMMLEPVVEFVGAKRIEAVAPEYTYAKHPSLLHLPCYLEGESVLLELKGSPKLVISKYNLIPAIQPDRRFFFDEGARSTFQTWLSLRYRRRDMPHAFVIRSLPLWTYLKKEGKKYASHVMGYWVSYDPRHKAVSTATPYTFSLYIVYASRNQDAQDQAEKLAVEVNGLFPEWKEKVKDQGVIDLLECKAYPDDCFTLADLQNCVYFGLEQINNLSEAREDPNKA